MTDFSPREIVSELDRYIVGQNDAKRAVAIALRNRWRRLQLDDKLREEVLPKNILMIGPTGVGKTEISRRLAKLAGAPFLKVEATKFTEVGYVGRDVEQIIRDLVEISITLTRDRKRKDVQARAEMAAEERVLDALVGPGSGPSTRESFRKRLRAGELNDKEIDIEVQAGSGSGMPMFEIPGMPGAQIVFNGPYKRREELERAVAEGALVNVDNFDELDLLIEVAGALRKTARTGLRINFQHGPQSWTKFGFSADNGDVIEALGRVKKAGRSLNLEALHNHSGTFQVNPNIYAKAAQVLIGIARRARELGMAPTIADFGGGYPSSIRLKPAFDVQEGSGANGRHLVPFAEAIVGALGRSRKAFGERPVMMLEPGRAVVDVAMRLACTVVARKNVVGRGDAIIVDAGVNLLPTAYWYDHGIDYAASEKLRSADGSRATSVFGPLCMQVDVLRERVMLPPMPIGAPMVVSNVGAYCLTQSMQFIQPRPAVVLMGSKGPEVIRKRETRSDIFALDKLPARLKSRGAGN